MACEFDSETEKRATKPEFMRLRDGDQIGTPSMKGDFVPGYPMVIKTQDDMKDLMKEIIKKLHNK